ncbi:MAG: hypothetical protein OEZ19_09090 [Paracoccaceae bacterium]|nr:hypothetical protein [Paracoccaceae bacterium]
MAAVLFVTAGGLVWVNAASRNATDQQPVATVVEECDSCAARHQNLSRLRDARSSAEGEDE